MSEPWPSLEEPIVFSAVRGTDQLHVQVVGGENHPNPSMMYVMLEVRLGPDTGAP
jgi:hypothetical protein